MSESSVLFRMIPGVLTAYVSEWPQVLLILCAVRYVVFGVYPDC